MTPASRRQLLFSAPLVLAGMCASCARLDTKSEVDVKPIEVKPIHITVDVNVRIDRALDNFFAFEEEAATTAPAAATAATKPSATKTTE